MEMELYSTASPEPNFQNFDSFQYSGEVALMPEAADPWMEIGPSHYLYGWATDIPMSPHTSEFFDEVPLVPQITTLPVFPGWPSWPYHPDQQLVRLPGFNRRACKTDHQ